MKKNLLKNENVMKKEAKVVRVLKSWKAKYPFSFNVTFTSTKANSLDLQSGPKHPIP